MAKPSKEQRLEVLTLFNAGNSGVRGANEAGSFLGFYQGELSNQAQGY